MEPSNKIIIVCSAIMIISSLVCAIIVAVKYGHRTEVYQLMLTTQTSDAPEVSNAGSSSMGYASAHQALSAFTYISVDEPVFMKENVVLEFGQDTDKPGLGHARNIDVGKSVITIKYPGLYKVYSSILFKPLSSKPCKDLDKQTWDHNVVLTRSQDTAHGRTILHMTHTCCGNYFDNEKTSYAGGLFYLQENDRLHVEVSSDGVVRFLPSGSYFGLFMVGLKPQQYLID